MLLVKIYFNVIFVLMDLQEVVVNILVEKLVMFPLKQFYIVISVYLLSVKHVVINITKM